MGFFACSTGTMRAPACRLRAPSSPSAAFERLIFFITDWLRSILSAKFVQWIHAVDRIGLRPIVHYTTPRSAISNEVDVPIAPTAKIAPDARIPNPDLVNLYGCVVGAQTSIGAFVEMQPGVVVGARCKISSHSFLCEG